MDDARLFDIHPALALRFGFGAELGGKPLALAADKTFALEHVYDDDGAYVVTVTVTDTNGASGTATAPVTIENVAPEAVLAAAAGDEGAPIAVTFSDQTDASNADAAAGFTYRYACDGTTLGPETPDPVGACTISRPVARSELTTACSSS